MEYLTESWSLWVILASAFIIGWAAEAAQTFMSRALALTLLAWLQTLPEFAVEATIAWNQQRDLMIANLTGSLRLLVGLGWPMIFFVHYFSHMRRKRVAGHRSEIRLDEGDFLGVIFLFISILYFIVILAKGSLTVWDAAILTVIYAVYLVLSAKLPVHDSEDEDDLPWIAQKIVRLPSAPRFLAVIGLFAIGGVGLYLSAHPFVETLQKWSLSWGISTFVFVQWLAPFLSEFPEKVTAFNWARQPKKAPMALMNMVSSNINQWTMLAAMIPVVFNLSLGRFEAIQFDRMHEIELALTIAQSALGGMLLLDMAFGLKEALGIFVLWAVQFAFASVREPVLVMYCVWIVFELGHIFLRGRLPRALEMARDYYGKKAA
jgi:cation:H+ antiporter